MFELPISRGLVALVDECDLDWIERHKWQASPRRRTYGPVYYVTRHRASGTVYMHREVIGAKTGEIVDHIDGNTLNNTRSNLRIANHSLNGANSVNRKNKVGYRGVSLCAESGLYVAYIQVNQRSINLGRVGDAADAARLYDAAARAHFGEFARTNF